MISKFGYETNGSSIAIDDKKDTADDASEKGFRPRTAGGRMNRA
jgi:hypothetical protein